LRKLASNFVVLIVPAPSENRRFNRDVGEPGLNLAAAGRSIRLKSPIGDALVVSVPFLQTEHSVFGMTP
jgi:hypothetical protein